VWATAVRVVGQEGAVAIDVVSECLIARTPPEVAAFASDPDHVPLWYANIKSVEWKTERPARVGSQIRFVAHFLGRRIAYTYEVVEWVPDRRFVMRTAEGPFPMETSYAWEPTEGGGTLMTLRNRGTPTGFSVWVAPFMAMAVRRANSKDLARLKRVLESRGAAGG
jgi:hypothetical protein